MEIKRKYIIFSLLSFGLLKILIAILSIYVYASGTVSYLLNETVIFGVLGILLIIGALNLKYLWGRALAALFFAFIAIKHFSLLLAAFDIQWPVELITGREVVGSPYWYINVFLIVSYSLIALGLWSIREKCITNKST